MKFLMSIGIAWVISVFAVVISVVTAEVWGKLSSRRKNIISTIPVENYRDMSESEFEEFMRQGHEEFMEFINNSIENINDLDEGRDKDHFKMSKTESGRN